MRLPTFLVRALHERLQRVAESRPPDFIVGAPGDDYLRRWWVIPRNRLFNIYLHEFRRSDDDRALHDHPWPNASILLSGRYTEHTIPAGGINVRKVYKAGDVKLRSAKAAHRVELHAGPCWSLFMTGPRLRDWGFHCRSRWVPWQEFTKPNAPGEIGQGCGEGDYP